MHACLLPTHSKGKVTVHMEIHMSAFAVVSSGCSFEFLKDAFSAVIATMQIFPISFAIVEMLRMSNFSSRCLKIGCLSAAATVHLAVHTMEFVAECSCKCAPVLVETHRQSDSESGGFSQTKRTDFETGRFYA